MKRRKSSTAELLDELRVEDPYEVEDLDAIAEVLARAITPEALEQLKLETTFEKYEHDPVGFVESVLGETLTEDVKEMLRSLEENRVTIAVSSNGVGKSHGAARAALWFFLVKPRAKVFTAAAPPIENLRNILWGEILSVADKHPELFPNPPKSLEIRKSPDEYLVGVTIPSSGTPEEREAKFSGKHAENLLFIFDEGDAIPDEVYRGAESCMSGGNAHMLIMLNPRKESGATWRMQRDHTANVVHLSALNHPNVVTGKTVIPGAVDRDTTIRRIWEWTRPLRDEIVEATRLFEVPEYLVGAVGNRLDGSKYPPLPAGKRVITNPAFSYMVLGRYPAQAANQLISREWINLARSRWDLYVSKYGETPPEGTQGIMGMDPAEMGDDPNAVIGRWGNFVSRPETWGGMDITVSASKAVDWFQSHRIDHAYIDATGVGVGIAPTMNKLGCPATPLKGAEKPTYSTDIGDFANLRAQLWWSLRLWMQKDAMLPPDSELIEELLAPTYEIKRGEIAVSSQDELKLILTRSPNKADALRMTFGGEIGSYFEGCVLIDEAPQ